MACMLASRAWEQHGSQMPQMHHCRPRLPAAAQLASWPTAGLGRPGCGQARQTASPLPQGRVALAGRAEKVGCHCQPLPAAGPQHGARCCGHCGLPSRAASSGSLADHFARSTQTAQQALRSLEAKTGREARECGACADRGPAATSVCIALWPSAGPAPLWLRLWACMGAFRRGAQTVADLRCKHVIRVTHCPWIASTSAARTQDQQPKAAP